MNKLARELFFNISVPSILLSVVYSYIVANVDASLLKEETAYLGDPVGFADVTFLFLAFYLLHILISLFQFFISRMVGNRSAKKLVIFNVSGLLICGLLYFYTKDLTWGILIASFILFSIVSLFNKTEQEEQGELS
ncbi:hypothetical protein [Paenibacillus faecalis]|uniref:hypothetical protein n=1 Tax=Paenibacillus faecalis TaxID=2079532 RepID=UPI000D0FD1F7|nr:hypothetical protein [Paenibacillus faecalis]